MSDIEKIHGITPDLTKENVDRLLALFPDVATEITDPKTGRMFCFNVCSTGSAVFFRSVG